MAVIRKVLLVDDEVSILRAIKRLLRREAYEVLTAENAQEAIALVKAHPDLQVVISDYRMPDMDGGALTIELKKYNPNMVCMLLSGYADLSSVIGALNSGAVYKFLEKPWDDEHLLIEVDAAFKQAEVLQQQNGLTRLAQQSDSALFEIDMEGMVYHLNQSSVDLCQAEEARVVGRCLSEFIHVLQPRHFQQLCLSDEVTLELPYYENGVVLKLHARPLSLNRWLLRIGQHSRFGVLGVEQLLPRRELISRLRQVLNAGIASTVINFNVSSFRHYNENLGYQEADKLLAILAQMIIELKPSESSLGRLGADEFVLLLPCVLPPDEITQLIQQIQQPFNELIPLPVGEVYVNFNIGYAITPDDGDTPEEVLQNASLAVEQAKQRGKGYFPRYKASMQSHDLDLIRLQSDLYRALSRNQLSVHYQPKVNLSSGQIVGAEALVRWQHEELGMISPAIFIPLAEACGLIDEIGEWVLLSACVQAQLWQQKHLNLGVISVNLSGHQLLDEKLVEQIDRALDESGLSPEMLELEVTETYLMQDIEQGLNQLHQIRDRGVKVAIDDFGTGYSSLNYLNRLPANTLKIDRSFVESLTSCSECRHLVSNIIRMSHDMGMSVVSEGVETAEQLELLREYKSDEVQGFYLHKPLPASEFEKLLMAGWKLSEPVLMEGI